MSTLVVFLALLPGQARDDTKRDQDRRVDVVLEWNTHALEAIRRDRTAPPVAARNLAIVHAAAFDAVNTAVPGYSPYLVKLRATDNIDPHVAAAVAAHRALVSLYPKQKSRLDRLLDRYLDGVPADSSKNRGVSLGRYVADKLLAARRDDLAERYTTFKPSEEVGLWRPTLPGKAAALLPEWGKTKPFGVKSVKAFRVPPPPDVSSQEYATDLEEVRLIGARNSRVRTAEESIIAWFWDDGPGTCTPPGHWNQVARAASVEKNLSLAENARLFALLNIALADASVACWHCKYRDSVWRPITAIREGNPDDKQAARDPKWLPLLNTPPFPSYTSGHSTFSGAAAALLAKFFDGDDFEFTVGSDGFPGQKRTYSSFSQAAAEAGRSRVYGGIHFEFDNGAGQTLGKAIAEEVFRTRLKKE